MENVSALVSVIIPAYNSEHWIRETVNSALLQTYPNVEIIVVNDLSTDGTGQILNAFQDQIRVLNNPINLGTSSSRNKAIEASRGTYIAFLDHDDLWLPDKLEKQMRLFNQDRQLGLVYSDAFYETSNMKRWRSFQLNPPYRMNVFENFLLQNFIPSLTAVVPRQVLERIGTFRPNLRVAQDFELFLRILNYYPVDYVNEPLAIHRTHALNASHHVDSRFSEWLDVLKAYRSRAGVGGLIAMVYIRWGVESWRTDEKRGAGILRIVHGLLSAVRNPVSFYRAFQDAWQQKQNARRL